MGTLGPYLREAREARGLDLREAAQQTRISVTYLKAIEDEDFQKLPGEVFVKGFLKSYAKFLLLSEEEVMKRYGELKAPPARPDAGPSSAAHREEEGRRPVPEVRRETEPFASLGRKRNLEPFVWSGVAVIGLAAIILTFLPGKHGAERNAPEISSTETATSDVSALTSTAAVPAKLYLEIEALEDTWVLIRTDGSPQKHAVLKKGETITWSADERFLLSYGSVGAVVLRLNGRELAVTGPKNAAVRDLLINAQGIEKQKLEPERPRTSRPASASKPSEGTAPSATTIQSRPASTRTVHTAPAPTSQQRQQTAPVSTMPQTEHTAPASTIQQTMHTAPAPTPRAGMSEGPSAAPPQAQE